MKCFQRNRYWNKKNIKYFDNYIHCFYDQKQKKKEKIL